MTHFAIPSIFWTTMVATGIMLSFATLIGRAWALALPISLQPLARFYLAPAFGLATITIIASRLGRHLQLGNSIIVPCAVIALLAIALSLEHNRRHAIKHALTVGVFGLVCGVSVLGPLFAYGAFNAHNDAFTYLAHSNWLQLHAFDDAIPAEQIAPFSTQISLYQLAKLRMGASFLLAFMQAVLDLHWSFETYPAVIISSITTCCLAIGFLLARKLRPLPRHVRLALLALPAFTLGGLVFGGNFGFLPQTVGLALAAPLLFLLGPLMRWAATSTSRYSALAKSTLPAAVLFAGATYAYTELIPFVTLTIVICVVVLAISFGAWRRLIAHGAIVGAAAAALLNTELIRALVALRSQSGAVVGTPVDWSLAGFISHALGVHGGAWDLFQWADHLPTSFSDHLLGYLLLFAALALLSASLIPLLRVILSGVMMPVAVILAIFSAGLIYFRYFVVSPFPQGLGESWSEFKLADWAHPFAMALVLFAITSLRPRFGSAFKKAIAVLFVVGFASAIHTGVQRVKPLMNYYSGVHDLNRFYLTFRETVLAACPTTEPIFLSLGGDHQKFRELATLYLYDRDLASDWTDDGYLYPRMAPDRRTQKLSVGECVVEPADQGSSLTHSTAIGPFRVGIYDGRGPLHITNVNGAYGRESDGQNWWNWVERKVIFTLQPLSAPKEAVRTTVHFEYATRGAQNLTLQLLEVNGAKQEIILNSAGDAPTVFDKTFDVPPAALSQISIETDGTALPLGKGDPRLAAWIVRNLSVTPMF